MPITSTKQLKEKIKFFKLKKHYRNSENNSNCLSCNHSFLKKTANEAIKLKCEFLGDSCGHRTDVSSRKVCNMWIKREDITNNG